MGSTDSAASDTSSQIGRKLKKTLKDLDFGKLIKKVVTPKNNLQYLLMNQDYIWMGDFFYVEYY